MANEIKVGKNESIDSALRRFKRMSQKAGTLAEVRKREHYEKPSVRRKKKSEAARNRKFRSFARDTCKSQDFQVSFLLRNFSLKG